MKNSDLLDELAARVGCICLSDLHYRPYLELARLHMRTLEPERYSLKQWTDAIRYLLGRESDCKTPQEAHALLCGEPCAAGDR